MEAAVKPVCCKCGRAYGRNDKPVPTDDGRDAHYSCLYPDGAPPEDHRDAAQEKWDELEADDRRRGADRMDGRPHGY